MAEESNIKQELLKQMEKDSNEVSDINLRSPQEIIARGVAHLRWLKWITALSWLITIIYFIAIDVLKSAFNYLTEGERWLVQHSDTGLIVLVVIAVLFTVSIYIKSRILTIRQIHVRLSGIEEQLKKMAQDK